MKKLFLLLACFFIVCAQANAQESTVLGRFNASNPNLIEKQFGMDFESYFFVANDKLYTMNFRFDYNFNSKRTMVRFNVPLVSTDFSKDYQGYERSTGIGDLGFKVTHLIYLDKANKKTLESVALSLGVTTPTGDKDLGLGLGKWQYIPEIVAAFRASPALGFYPRAKFQFTGSEVNGHPTPGGSAPDPEDPDADGQFKTLIIDLPMIMEINSWQGWFGLTPIYLNDFEFNYTIVALTAELGKNISDQSSISLHLSQNIAGEKRLLNIVEAKLNFYIK